jgi:hypothetical protein
MNWYAVSQNLKSDKDIPIFFRLFAGGTAGFVATTATYPLHVVRRRMQVMANDPSIPQYKSTVHGMVV